MNEQLTAPKAVVLEEYGKAKTKGKVRLERIFGLKTFCPNIMDRIKGFDDICREMGKNPKDYICKSDDKEDIAANALKMARLIVKCYNGDKVLDWSNSNQPKYCHVYVFSPSAGWSLRSVGDWYSDTLCGSRLHFFEKAHAQDAWDKFSEIFINLID
jgi:hypothetical protein